MFERFTEQARHVVVLAQEEARGLGHAYIGTEHILLGLLREHGGVAARALAALGIAAEPVREEVARIIGAGDEVPSGQIPFTPRAKKVLELALREALALGQNDIGTEHILLGLVREQEGVAAQILVDFDAEPERIRNEVLRLLSGPGGRPAGPAAAAEAAAPVRPPRAPHPLRPPLDWGRAGALWRPDRIVAGLARELEGVAARVLERELGVSVSRARRRRPGPGPRARLVPARAAGPPPPPPPRVVQGSPRSRGLVWARATLLWRPEGLELRVPLRLVDPDAMACFAGDEVWGQAPLGNLRREIWGGWLALASPTLLEDVDPAELRRLLDAAAERALTASEGERSGRAREFLRRLQG